MRWAEGHTHNVRKHFMSILGSRYVSPIEKLEFLYDATYYLQAGLFVVGSVSWLVSEVFLHTHVPGWTALLGWSLLFSNIFALPLMNLGGLILEEAPARDLQGVLGALVLSFALVPFQGWAAFKGLISKDEGPWFRTPKTGRVTDEVRHLRRLQMLRRWLTGRRGAVRWTPPPVHVPVGVPPPVVRATPRRRWIGWIAVGILALVFSGLAVASVHAPVVSAAGNPLYLHATGTGPSTCTASTIDANTGTKSPACQIQSAAGAGVTTTWAWTGLPAQTVAAGTWTYTMYWTGGTGATSDSVSVAVGVSATASCAGFVPLIPAATTTWSANYGASTSNTTSPLTFSTSASQPAIVIPAGGSLCVSVTLVHNTGGKPSMVYDGGAGTGNTGFVPPSIIVPEGLLGFAALAVFVPVAASRLVRRRRA
jgi:hypothetical protein